MMAQIPMRFFRLVWLCIGLRLATGLVRLLGVGMKQAPVGWHLMLGIGLLMFAVFGHLYFGPFRRLHAAVEAADWPQAGQKLGQLAKLAQLNLALGALAIAAVALWR